MAAPVISADEMSAFHATHFSATSTAHFTTEFLGSEGGQYAQFEAADAESHKQYYAEEGEEDEDGLGYYADGVKCTLTGEQIAIFRHSEIQTLLRERRHAKEAREDEDLAEEVEETAPTPVQAFEEPILAPIPEPPRRIIGPVMEVSLEDGELEEDTTETQTPPAASGVRPSQTKSKKKKKPQKVQQRDTKPKGFFKQNVKPDLRKRTWDVVDKGVDGLDYDEMEGAGSARPTMTKRRQISYDD